MGGKTHPPYPPEFQTEEVELVCRSGKSIPQVARELGVSEQGLRTWVKRANVDAGVGLPGALTTAEADRLYQDMQWHDEPLIGDGSPK